MVAANKSNPAESFRRESPRCHRHISAHRMSDPYRLVDTDSVEQVQHILRHHMHAVRAIWSRTLPMPSQVRGNDPAHAFEVFHLSVPDCVIQRETMQQQKCRPRTFLLES